MNRTEATTRNGAAIEAIGVIMVSAGPSMREGRLGELRMKFAEHPILIDPESFRVHQWPDEPGDTLTLDFNGRFLDGIRLPGRWVPNLSIKVAPWRTGGARRRRAVVRRVRT